MRDPAVERQRAMDILSRAVDAAERLRPLFSDPAVQAFFDDQEQRLIDAMVDAKPSDDEARRDAAIELQVWRKIRTGITKQIQNGPRALKKLEAY